jgi:hypothetical protein
MVGLEIMMRRYLHQEQQHQAAVDLKILVICKEELKKPVSQMFIHRNVFNLRKFNESVLQKVADNIYVV